MRLICSYILYVILSLRAAGQCTPPGGVPVVACGTGTALANNTTITTGTFNATGGSFSGVTLSGGTLVLCGTVTLSDITINSGSLIVNAGATVTVNPNYNANGGSIFSSGTMIFNTSVGIQGTNPIAYNGPGATVTVNGTLTVFNSGDFYNNGTATAQAVVINSGAALCAAGGSTANVVDMTNNQTNSITVPSGESACIHYTGTLLANNTPISSGGTLIICEDAAASAPSGNLGTAQVVTNCSSCQSVLPVTLISFTGTRAGDQVHLQWVTAVEDNLLQFAIQSSRDGVHFQTIDTVDAKGQSATYEYTTSIPANTWYRLQMIDRNGNITYSRVVFIEWPATGFSVSILSNPVRQSSLPVSIHLTTAENGEMTLFDNAGRQLKRQHLTLKAGRNDLQFPLEGLGAGYYYLQFKGSSGDFKTLAFIYL